MAARETVDACGQRAAPPARVPDRAGARDPTGAAASRHPGNPGGQRASAPPRRSTRLRNGWMRTSAQIPAARNGSAWWNASTAARSGASSRKRLPIIVAPSSARSGPETRVSTGSGPAR
ncbi:hypothetical protein OPKNFCMD_3952 [Methylobacterium crusticola]|uniref:Uncharacterized protein n=1 Tax=Methylobacterium crusticola TaxID=1697972 RepID=A0ABQ4R226_9HYPH|nr:hypothetical protein OPKNFCMD_3952 [Methylobacterium crusticola]